MPRMLWIARIALAIATAHYIRLDRLFPVPAVIASRTQRPQIVDAERELRMLSPRFDVIDPGLARPAYVRQTGQAAIFVAS